MFECSCCLLVCQVVLDISIGKCTELVCVRKSPTIQYLFHQSSSTCTPGVISCLENVFPGCGILHSRSQLVVNIKLNADVKESSEPLYTSRNSAVDGYGLNCLPLESTTFCCWISGNSVILVTFSFMNFDFLTLCTRGSSGSQLSNVVGTSLSHYTRIRNTQSVGSYFSSFADSSAQHRGTRPNLIVRSGLL